MATHRPDARSMAAMARNYEQYFVPVIGAPVADDLMGSAHLASGERVLDVACGTGVVTRRAARQVGDNGRVTGLDVNPQMLEVAASATPSDLSIDWQQADAQAMPLPDGAFDAVLCQLSLPFMSDKVHALEEMRRVLADDGRIALSVPGDEHPIFQALARGLEQHVGPDAGGFVHQVFSLHDPREVGGLMREAGFDDVEVAVHEVPFRLPEPREFLWQYISSTPLAGPVGAASPESKTNLERDVVAALEPMQSDGALVFRQSIVVATARKKAERES